MFLIKANIILLKIMIFALFFFYYPKISAQKWNLIKSVNLIESTVNFSLDKYGNIVYSDVKGVIYKYDKYGIYFQNYSPNRPAEVSLLESWVSVSTFVFYKEFQKYTLLNRRLGHTGIFDLNTQTEFITLATPSSDGNIWLFDQDGFSVKKISKAQNETIVAIPLDLILKNTKFDVSFMKEYQNRLFLCDFFSGIMIFDFLGNYWKTIEVKNVKWFGTLEDELYFLLKENELKLINIYTENHRVMILPVHDNILGVLITKERLVLFTEEQIFFYKSI